MTELASRQVPSSSVPTPVVSSHSDAPIKSVVAMDARLAVGVLGIFLAAMIAGLNNRVGAIGLADVRGHLGFGLDDASWLNTAYTAGELVAMPFATWFALTFSLRHFHLALLISSACIAAVLPLVGKLEILIALRGLQGLTCGAMIPLLMVAALRFVPLSLRLYALSLYAMTATFSPNISSWLAALWTDGLIDWRWIYWQVIPLSAGAFGLVWWGIPQDPKNLGRFAQGNWFGSCFAIVGLVCITIALDQGNRLDWFNSKLVTLTLAAGALLTTVYLLTEWFHPTPFMRLQLLGRRNLAVGFSIFFALLALFLSGSLLPTAHLERIWGHRPLQYSPIGLVIGLPQLVIGPAVALLLYQKWMDARVVMAAGLGLVALACLTGSALTSEWMWRQFLFTQMLQAFGQPMAVVAMLFLATSVVQPMEGPFVAGIVNTLRALGALVGGALVGRTLDVRSRFHSEMILDQMGRVMSGLAVSPPTGNLNGAVNHESVVLATADAYRLIGVLALLLVPAVFLMKFIPAPDFSRTNAQ